MYSGRLMCKRLITNDTLETFLMKKIVKVSSVVILSVVLITGVLAVSGYAGKPSGSGSSRTVVVSGAIVGDGEPERIKISFYGAFLVGEEYEGPYVANPDGGLEVFGTRKGPRTLRYRYCYAGSHSQPNYCGNLDHDPSHYRALRIYGGTLEGKGGDTQIVWLKGSTWEIYSKDPYGALVATGQLEEEVTYRQKN